jgi:hypothetical protein
MARHWKFSTATLIKVLQRAQKIVALSVLLKAYRTSLLKVLSFQFQLEPPKEYLTVR